MEDAIRGWNRARDMVGIGICIIQVVQRCISIHAKSTGGVFG